MTIDRIVNYFMYLLITGSVFYLFFAIFNWSKIVLLSNPIKFIYLFFSGLSNSDDNYKDLYFDAHQAYNNRKPLKAEELLKAKISKDLDFSDFSSVILLAESLDLNGKTQEAIELIENASKWAPEEFEKFNNNKQITKLLAKYYGKVPNNEGIAKKYWAEYQNYNREIRERISSELQH